MRSEAGSRWVVAIAGVLLGSLLPLPNRANAVASNPTSAVAADLINVATPSPGSIAVVGLADTVAPNPSSAVAADLVNVATPSPGSIAAVGLADTVAPNPTSAVASNPTNTAIPGSANTAIPSPMDTATLREPSVAALGQPNGAAPANAVASSTMDSAPSRKAGAAIENTAAGSPAARRVGLADVLRLAEQRSLDMRRAQARTDIAQGEAKEATLQWIPTLTASTGFAKTDGQVQGSFGKLKDVEFQTVAPYGRLGYQLNPGKALFDTRAASHMADSAMANEASRRREVLLQVAQLYYDLVSAGTRVNVAVQAVADARELLKISQVLLRRGTGRGDDVERAKAEVATAEKELTRARQQFAHVSILLAASLDLSPAERLVPLDDELSVRTLVALDNDINDLVSKAMEGRPEIALAKKQMEARRAQRLAAIATLASPSFEAYYQESGTGERYTDLDRLQQYGVAMTWTLSASALSHVDTMSGRMREAQVALDQSYRVVSADVAMAFEDARSSFARMGPARRAREGSEAAFRITQVRFRNGRALAVEVIEAERSLVLARLGEVASVVDYNKAQLRLRAALGGASAADLQADSPMQP